MPYVENYDVIVNIIDKATYDSYIANGTITDAMLEEEVWYILGDQYLSQENLSKLEGIAAGAQVNVIDGIKLNGIELPIEGKKVNIIIPTKLSDLQNDEGFISSESDPTVPAWAKAASKPSYSYDEITGKPSLFSGNYNDLTNKPTIPSVEGLASENYVDGKIADLVNSAPTTLDTLGEIAAAIQDNEDVVGALNSAIGNKVDKVDGKGLSTNDYTTAEKNKLAGIETGANNYVLPSDVVQDSNYVHTDNNYSADEKAKVTANTNARHSHSNNAVLNNTTAPFTTELKAKLDGISAGANKCVVRIWS